MAAILTLPPKSRREDLKRAIVSLVNPAVAERNRWQVGWFVAQGYMEGVRTFFDLDYANGAIQVDDFDDEDEFAYDPDEIPFRWEKALALLQIELGRLARLDTSPFVRKTAHSLQSLKDASISQVLLDNTMRNADPEGIAQDFLFQLVAYGTAALADWSLGEDTPAFESFTEVIPPWELLGLPGGTKHHSDERAMGRTRLYSLEELRTLPGIKLPDDEGEMEIVRLPAGAATSMAGISGGGYQDSEHLAVGTFANLFDIGMRKDGGQARDASEQPENEPFVRLREIWIKGLNGTVARSLAFAGRAPIWDVDYTEKKGRTPGGTKVPFPLGIGRYQDIGTFYGRSFLSRLIPPALRLERLIHRLLTNVDDFDRLGLLGLPMDMGIDVEMLKATGTPRYFFYERDPTSSQDPVQQIAPSNSSDIPGRVAQLVDEGMDGLSLQGPLYGGLAPGRAESGEAFQTLAQTGSTHLIPTAKSIGKAYATLYRSKLARLHKRLKGDAGRKEAILLTRIDNDIMGIQVDPNTGQVTLGDSGVPDPWSVEIGIRSEDPVSSDWEKEMGPQMLQTGLLLPNEFVILNYKNNWGYPIGRKSVYENYVKAVLQNLMLFGDGQTPGVVGPLMNTKYQDNPEIHLMAIEDFVSVAEFSYASTEVQEAFFKRIEEFRTGMAMPAGAPTVDRAAADGAEREAMMQQVAQQQQQQQGQGQPTLPGGGG